jgi:hypothetical protein
MSEKRSCDICGHSEYLYQEDNMSGRPLISLDDDGLLICKTCQNRVKSGSITKDTLSDLDPVLKQLVGKSAGAICRTLELPFEPPYKVIIEAASKIAYDQDLYMSTYLFETLWLDGTTVWRASDGHAIALVTSIGEVKIQSTWGFEDK